MKVAILAGGRSTRMGECKAMVPIGGKPILWHIMRRYAMFGHRDFVIALGHNAQPIVQWAATLDEDWTIRLVETGLDTETGGRIKRLQPFLDDEPFMMTWCDGLADIDLDALLDFHGSHGFPATITAVHPPPRFGRLAIRHDGQVLRFDEKPDDSAEWINGGFFVLLPCVLDMIDGDRESFERETLPLLVGAGYLRAYRHNGFWRCMDTPKEAEELNTLWASGQAPWA